MTTAYVTPAQLASMLTIAKCASRDDMTPLIHNLRISVANNRIATAATDRYRAARLSLPLDETFTPTGGEFLVHPSLLEQAVKAAGRDVLNVPVIKLHSADFGASAIVELTHTGTVLNGVPVVGNFPAVERLMEGERPDDIPSRISLKSAFLATLKELRLPGETPKTAGDAAWALTTKRTESGKPGPVMFHRGEGEATLEYFLQPNLARP